MHAPRRTPHTHTHTRTHTPPTFSSHAPSKEATLIAEERAQLTRHGALESRTAGFLDSLQGAGQKALAQWPRDLFAPGLTDQEEQRTVELPEGQSGTISITRAASTDPETGLMMHYERQVRTRIGDDERVGSEAFLLAQKASGIILPLR